MLHIDAFVYSYFSVMMHSSEDSLHWPSVFSFDYFIEWEGGKNKKKKKIISLFHMMLKIMEK